MNKKTYLVYKHPKFDHFEPVKAGWSWPGFFFNWIWGFFKELYRYSGFMLFMACVPFAFMYAWAYPKPPKPEMLQVAELLTGMITVISAIGYGLHGNKFVENMLKAKGYKLVAIVTAYDPEEAVLEAIDILKRNSKREADYHEEEETEESISDE